MPLFSRAIFQLVHWAARKGLRDDHDADHDNHPGHSPAVRLHKDAFSPQL